MNADAREAAFQSDVVREMLDGGWLQGSAANYDRQRALYAEDSLAFVKLTQPKVWAKYQTLYPNDPDKAFLDRLGAQLDRADPQASAKHLRSFGTLGVLRHGLRDKACHFKLCQFLPDHGLNPDTLAMYQANILRVVPEVIYSPWVKPAAVAESGAGARAWRIDLVLFVNGIPVATLELKSEFKQAIERAITQYRKTRLPTDPASNKPEPLLSFKRGALVHFAVSQYEAWMSTRLAGDETRFLPFNRGTREGGAGNDVPEDDSRYATDYLWREVLAPANLLNIIGRYIHLDITDKETWDGRKYRQETLIFPRYHQWDLVTRLLAASRREGPGHRYLAQHSAGSGKSNSIAWAAHQLSSLHDEGGEKVFHSVIVITDRTVLDSQLQDTIYQFEHADGVVGRINRDEGQGSKSEKLAAALENSTPIVIVTIQTFPHVLSAIENSVSLKERRYAIIADEAHSSQTGRTANELRAVLSKDASDEDAEDVLLSAEDLLTASVAARQLSANLSYYAFTATPKPKTLELFGRLPEPDAPPSKTNKPRPFHIYSMRQAIEEGYILDVLKNYTSYKVAYQLAQKLEADTEVDAKKARVKLGRWVRLHDYNIAQKVQVIVEHFRDSVAGLLGGHAKAMVVTGSRKEAVRYKLGFDRYLITRGYTGLKAMIAFSGDVQFSEQDPNAGELIGNTYSEANMNPELKGRDLRRAFDSDDFHVMIVANKFQTGFDQPKLCAMYVDKKLAGVECVQTLSRLNRIYPGKEEIYVLDFFNEPEDVLAAFQEYYETAALLDVSDPEHIWLLHEKLCSSGIFLMTEVSRFAEAFFARSKSQAAISNICKPAVERWQTRHEAAQHAARRHRELLARAKRSGDDVLIGNADDELKEATKALRALEDFKKDLLSFVRYYEFMSQIVDYDSTDLEKLSLYARHLAPMLREKRPDEEPIDLSTVGLSHYRLSKLKQQDLQLGQGVAEGLKPGSEVGTSKPRSREEEFLSQIIRRLNETFITDGLTDNDLLDYARTISNKVSENASVMQQIRNNSPEQAMLGDYAGALDNAVMESGEAHQNQMNQVLSDRNIAASFGRVVFDLVVAMERERGGMAGVVRRGE